MTEEVGRAIVEYGLNNIENPEVLAGWDVVFTNAWLAVPIDGAMMIMPAMTNMEREAIFLRVNECHWDSGVVHEMTHVVLMATRGDGDVNHLLSSVWEEADGKDDKLRRSHCPAGYTYKKRRLPTSVHGDM
jgi:hypothetical protein